MTDRLSPWWQPHVHADRRPLLLARNRIVAGIRQWFEAREFVEADCGALQGSPGNEAHLHAFATRMIGPDGTSHARYLHTSPEFACKKLLAAGETRLFSLAKVYRNRERTDLHAPEFTMLEWYRAREGYRSVMADCIELLRLGARSVGTDRLRYKHRTADPFRDPEFLTVAEAFRSINDNDRDILSHAGVLVAIVQQNCFRSSSNCRAAPFCAILGDPDRGEGSQQQRLIADLCRGIPARIYEDRPFETAAVPARHDMGNAAAL